MEAVLRGFFFMSGTKNLAELWLYRPGNRSFAGPQDDKEDNGSGVLNARAGLIWKK